MVAGLCFKGKRDKSPIHAQMKTEVARPWEPRLPAPSAEPRPGEQLGTTDPAHLATMLLPARASQTF